MEDDSRKIKVTANDISLKLTLTPKLLKKSFEDAVIVPFIKAYNKRADVAVSKLDLLGVRIDDGVLKDALVPASVVLLKNETVCAELTFRAAMDPAMELPSNPFQAPPAMGGYGMPSVLPGTSLPSGTREKLVDFQDDDRSEIDRMKAGQFAEGMLVDASKRAAALSSAVGKLQARAGMDEISLGELDEAEVQPARTRRKAVNAKLEDQLLPAARALPAEVKSALATL